jgi:hypothetical protein
MEVYECILFFKVESAQFESRSCQKWMETIGHALFALRNS